jgi:hypothetical protein
LQGDAARFNRSLVKIEIKTVLAMQMIVDKRELLGMA